MKHVAILGGGSAAFTAVHRAHGYSARVTVVNEGLPLGGTCLNVGCVPSKAYIRAAEALHHGSRSRFAGIQLQSKLTDFAEVAREKQEIVDTLRRINYEETVPTLPNFELIEGHGRLHSKRAIAVGDRVIEADVILVATGSATFIPPVEGIDDIPYLTNDSLYELTKLPESIIVLGGRYIALECAQMLARLGVKVTVLQRSERILPDQTQDMTDLLTQYLRKEGLDIVTGVRMQRMEGDARHARVHASVNGEARIIEAERILVATGRRANSDNLGLDEVGVALSQDASIRVDASMQTTVAGIYAAGDVAGDPMFVYTASNEAEIAIDNALGGKNRTTDYSALPWVIFTDPQVAGAGMDEREAATEGLDVDVSILPSIRVPRLRVSHDDRGFIKLIRNRTNDQLVGARFICHEAGELSMQASLLMQAGTTIEQICEMPHPYLTLSEAIQRAASLFE